MNNISNKQLLDFIFIVLILIVNIYAMFNWDIIKANDYYLGLYRGLIYPALLYIMFKNHIKN